MKNLPGLIYIDILVYLTVNSLVSENLEGLSESAIFQPHKFKSAYG
jgi:hypothetical protein